METSEAKYLITVIYKQQYSAFENASKTVYYNVPHGTTFAYDDDNAEEVIKGLLTSRKISSITIKFKD
jgi:hypothetical protein